jgi:PIN domain nuclease of toxin-antitoxin system
VPADSPFNRLKLHIEGTEPVEIAETIERSGIELLEVKNELFASYYTLAKKENHRDPFYRMLIWQAINEDLILITHDKRSANTKKTV